MALNVLNNSDSVDAQDDANTVDLDPDLNFYREGSTDCITKYYVESEINEIVKQNTDYNTGFSLMHLNIRNSPKNLDKLSNYLAMLDVHFSVVGLSETWLNSDTLGLYELDGYKSIHLARPLRKGGGVSLYIGRDYDYTEKPEMTVMTEYLECIFVEVACVSNKTKQNILIGVVYRPPNTDMTRFTEHITQIIKSMKTDKKQCYIMGDFNINLLNYDTHQETRDYVDTMFSNACIPLISRPTRITPTTATLIDNIYSNDLMGNNNQINGILYADISDHLPIFVLTKRTSDLNDDIIIETRKQNESTIHTFRCLVDNICWQHVYACDDPDESYRIFLEKNSLVYDEAFPIIKRKVRQSKCKPWITKGIKNSIKTKHKLYKKYVNKPTKSNEIHYKKYKNKLTVIIRLSHKSHYQNELNKNRSNLKNAWQILREIIGKRSKFSNNREFLIDGNKTQDKQLISDRFNEYFTSIGPKLAEHIPQVAENPIDYMRGSYTNSIFLVPVTTGEINRIIDQFKNCSSGWVISNPV